MYVDPEVNVKLAVTFAYTRASSWMKMDRGSGENEDEVRIRKEIPAVVEACGKVIIYSDLLQILKGELDSFTFLTEQGGAYFLRLH